MNYYIINIKFLFSQKRIKMQSSHSSKKALIVKTNIKLERTSLFQQITQPKKTLPLHKYPSNNLFFNNQLDTTPKQTNYQNTKSKKIQLTTSNTNINLTGKSKFNNNNINSNTTKNNKKQTNKVIKFFSFSNKNNNNISIKNKNTLRVINFFSPIKKKNNRYALRKNFAMLPFLAIGK